AVYLFDHFPERMEWTRRFHEHDPLMNVFLFKQWQIEELADFCERDGAQEAAIKTLSRNMHPHDSALHRLKRSLLRILENSVAPQSTFKYQRTDRRAARRRGRNPLPKLRRARSAQKLTWSSSVSNRRGYPRASLFCSNSAIAI